MAWRSDTSRADNWSTVTVLKLVSKTLQSVVLQFDFRLAFVKIIQGLNNLFESSWHPVSSMEWRFSFKFQAGVLNLKDLQVFLNI